jgi:formylglycine-generating enzyme required for sulfatase activity
MHGMNLFQQILILLSGVAISLQAVPPVLNYAGQVTVNGEAFDGNGLFKFALVNADGTTTYWSNDGTSVDGSEPQAAVSVTVNGGLYAVLLGNTAQQGMGAIDPTVFVQHSDAKLRVWFSDGVNGFQQLSPDRPFASVPYAFSAGTAQTAGSASIANGSISKSMLGQDVLSELNRTVTPQMIQSSSITTAQLNEQILKYLKPEITITPEAPDTVYSGQAVVLKAGAEGKFLTYQWYKNGDPIPNAQDKNLQIYDIKKSIHDGNYTVIISNDFGEVVSPIVKLDINISRQYLQIPSASNLEMIWVNPQKFIMGQIGVYAPEHNVTLTNGYYLGKTEVTQKQYASVMLGNTDGLSTHPSGFTGDDLPVDSVTWSDIKVFLKRLNQLESNAGRLETGWEFVLPTEAEWEFACRAGSRTTFSWGDQINKTNANWNYGNDINMTASVMQFPENNWGFFDMHGNVWELTSDFWGQFTSSEKVDPEGAIRGMHRVQKGGSWNDGQHNIRASWRMGYTPSKNNPVARQFGFRIALKKIMTDTSSPQIFLAQSSNIIVNAGMNFVEPGFQAHDIRDGDITGKVSVTGVVDVNSTGNYNLTYMVSDAAGNTTTATRIVTVWGNRSVDLNATVTLDMIWCPPGSFTMGSDASESGRRADENETVVYISKGFFLGKYEVTNEQWAAIYGSYGGPNGWVGLNLPATSISWENAQDFIARLNESEEAKNNLPEGWSYSLPTEAEWEYACKAGSTTRFSWGNDINSSKANYNWSGSWNSGDDAQRTISVGQFSPNQWGFYDMHGNVLEWTLDWYGPYPNSPSTDPKGPSFGSQRVNRGGSWYNSGNDLRSSRRPPFPTRRSYAYGFRLALKFDAQE